MDGTPIQGVDITIEGVSGRSHGRAYPLDDTFLATGDGVFVDNVARPDPELGAEGAPSSAGPSYLTLRERVLPMPDQRLWGGTQSCPAAIRSAGGSCPATIGELEELGALHAAEESFVPRVLEDLPPLRAYHEIIDSNLGQRDVVDDVAFGSERGPKHCAASRGRPMDGEAS